MKILVVEDNKKLLQALADYEKIHKVLNKESIGWGVNQLYIQFMYRIFLLEYLFEIKVFPSYGIYLQSLNFQ